MRVLCCYVKVRQKDRSASHPLAEAALRKYLPQAERVDVSHSPTAYAETLGEWWDWGVEHNQGFINIEHDIEVHEKVLSQATHCPEPWCIWPYIGPGWPNHHPPLEDAYLYQSLGCVRFHRKLLQAEPDAMRSACTLQHSSEFTASHWLRMDAEISPQLIGRGYHPHVHWPAVLHHHVYGQYGCACGGQHE